MSDRAAQIELFLKAAGWETAIRNPVPGDASARRYERLILNDNKAVLMDDPSVSSGSAYAQTAKLADGHMEAFTGIAEALTMRGFSAPKILAADMPKGLLLLEDLGDDLFARVIADDPEKERELYIAAVKCLGAIHRSTFAPVLDTQGAHWPLRSYDAPAMRAEVDLMLEWYVPYKELSLSAAQISHWHNLWDEALLALTHHAPGLVLRDFHAENIFWLPEREGNERIGLIDFQDALYGHPAYDLVSLIEDARRDVSPDLAEDLILQFCKSAKLKDDEQFRAAYAVMGAQRNAKILGIFVRLAQRDGKASYLDLLPRVEAHFKQDLSHTVMADIKAFLKDVI